LLHGLELLGHGAWKGPQDRVGACLKQALQKEQDRPDSMKIHNASDVVHYLEVAMNAPNAAYLRVKHAMERHF
jgi:hypothetical protein